MNWDDLKFFLAVARRRKLRRAGADLKVDQATVGRRISALEERLDAKLFERGSHGYELTETGRRLLPGAERVEAEMTALEGSAGRLGGVGVSGAVRISAPVGIGTYCVPAVIADVAAEHPRLAIQLVDMPRSGTLARREADIAITVSRPERGRIVAEKICDYALYAYATERFLARFGPILRVEDLRRAAVIGYVRDLIPDPELDYAPLIDPEIRPVLTSSDLNVQMSFALADGGVVILPAFMAARQPRLRKILPNRVRLRRSYWLVVHEEIVNQERIKLVADRLVKDIRQMMREVERRGFSAGDAT